MSAATSIEWTDRTWNPTRGCSMAKGSEAGGCLNCYAARLALRFSWARGLARMTASGPRWTGVVRLIPEALAEPLSWRKPQRIFVNSMSDLFHEALPNEAIASVFGVMTAARQHTFQILTKRPERMRDWFSWLSAETSQRRRRHEEEEDERVAALAEGGFTRPVPRPATWTCRTAWELGRRAAPAAMDRARERPSAPWPLPNVWLGVSVEDQATADERIPLLLQTPAAVRFVSYEPALGPVDFERWLTRPGECLYGPDGRPQLGLDWLIVGGESGPGARPFDVAWARATVAQCKAAGVRAFVKQLGARPFENRCEACLRAKRCACCYRSEKAVGLRLRDRKGGDMAEWPEDLRVREMPEARRG